jgi:hypothetical protein
MDVTMNKISACIAYIKCKLRLVFIPPLKKCASAESRRTSLSYLTTALQLTCNVVQVRAQ